MPTEQEQQNRFDALAAEVGESLAYFYCCIAFDIPFDLEAIPRDEPRDRWLDYLDNLRVKGLDRNDEGEPFGFLDGLTDIVKIFGEGLKDGEFSKIVSAEKSARKKKPGTQRQRDAWGTGDEKRPYSKEDYDELDRLYKVMSSELESAGGISVKQEFILRRCAKRTLMMQEFEAKGLYDKATKIAKLIDQDLASEMLRKKDLKPIDDTRLDDLTVALERSGIMKDGKFCAPDEMFRILFGRPPKYPYTKDAVEQAILINENRMRNNDGMPELGELPDDMRLYDELGEFAEEQSPQEMEAYEKLGLVKMPPAGKKKKKK